MITFAPIRKYINYVLRKTLALKLYSLDAHGREDCFDIQKVGHPIRIILDIGANIGQSATKFRAAFAEAEIFCFEPIDETFATLVDNKRKDPGIRCIHAALGSTRDIGKMFLTAHSTTHSLVEPVSSVGTQQVRIDTVDDFCREHNITKIDLLKIDVEGFDLEVLRGAINLLSAARVAFVLVEVGFNPADARHVLFDDVREFLLGRGYSLFGFYDQTLEWSGEKQLRFANACFVNRKALEPIN